MVRRICAHARGVTAVSLRAPVVAMTAWWYACAPAPVKPLDLADHPACAEAGSDAAAGRESLRAWIAVRPYTASEVRDPLAKTKARKLARVADRTALAVLSHPAHPDPRRAARTRTADQALALLWFAWNGDEATARGLAETLVLLQNDDGGFGDEFGVGEDDAYSASLVRADDTARATGALAYHARRFDDPRARAAALRGAARLTADVGQDGLVRAGHGDFEPRGSRFDPAVVLREARAGHQFEAYAVFAAMRPQDAQDLRDAVTTHLWIAQDGRFARAVGQQGRDAARDLEAAGTLGALFWLAAGNTARAQASLAYTERVFSAQAGGLSGLRPHVEPVAGAADPPEADLISLQASFVAGLAHLRLGERAKAEASIRTGSLVACMTAGTLPAYNREAATAPLTPSLAAALWWLFLEREYRTGERAPLFEPPPDAPDAPRP